MKAMFILSIETNDDEATTPIEVAMRHVAEEIRGRVPRSSVVSLHVAVDETAAKIMEALA